MAAVLRRAARHAVVARRAAVGGRMVRAARERGARREARCRGAERLKRKAAHDDELEGAPAGGMHR